MTVSLFSHGLYNVLESGAVLNWSVGCFWAQGVSGAVVHNVGVVPRPGGPFWRRFRGLSVPSKLGVLVVAFSLISIVTVETVWW